MITLLQFMIHFFICGAIMIMWQPVLTVAGYENPLYDGADIQVIAVRDAFWYFGIIIGVIGVFGNILWYYNELKNKAASEL